MTPVFGHGRLHACAAKEAGASLRKITPVPALEDGVTALSVTKV